MNWYKIRVNDGSDGYHTYIGCSTDSPEVMTEKAARGEYIRLDYLRYTVGAEVKEWSQRESREIATVYINPATIVTIMQFKADPRTTLRQGA